MQQEEGIRRAIRAESSKDLLLLVGIVEFACVSVPVLLALILWRVW